MFDLEFITLIILHIIMFDLCFITLMVLHPKTKNHVLEKFWWTPLVNLWLYREINYKINES